MLPPRGGGSQSLVFIDYLFDWHSVQRASVLARWQNMVCLLWISWLWAWPVTQMGPPFDIPPPPFQLPCCAELCGPLGVGVLSLAAMSSD